MLGKKYTWKRIQTSEEFINDIKAQSASGFDAVEESALKKAAFVFRFCETESKTKHALGSTSTTYYVVDSITIARMYFLTKDGKYFNLGVVHDLVGTDGMPDASITVGDNILNNLEDLTGKLDGWFEVIKIILLAILVIVFIGPITKVLSFVWDCIVNIVKIITKPIKNLFNRRRN